MKKYTNVVLSDAQYRNLLVNLFIEYTTATNAPYENLSSSIVSFWNVSYDTAHNIVRRKKNLLPSTINKIKKGLAAMAKFLSYTFDIEEIFLDLMLGMHGKIVVMEEEIYKNQFFPLIGSYIDKVPTETDQPGEFKTTSYYQRSSFPKKKDWKQFAAKINKCKKDMLLTDFEQNFLEYFIKNQKAVRGADCMTIPGYLPGTGLSVAITAVNRKLRKYCTKGRYYKICCMDRSGGVPLHVRIYALQIQQHVPVRKAA